MPTTITDESRKALEVRVATGDAELNEVLSRLAESLGEYGFAGTLELQLTVTLKDAVFGGDHVKVRRATELKFRR